MKYKGFGNLRTRLFGYPLIDGWIPCIPGLMDGCLQELRRKLYCWWFSQKSQGQPPFGCDRNLANNGLNMAKLPTSTGFHAGISEPSLTTTTSTCNKTSPKAVSNRCCREHGHRATDGHQQQSPKKQIETALCGLTLGVIVARFLGVVKNNTQDPELVFLDVYVCCI